MRRWLETQGYALCFQLAYLNLRGWPLGWLERLWTCVWYHYYCPYPIQGNWTARACNAAECCGCSNGDRFHPQRSETPEAGRG